MQQPFRVLFAVCIELCFARCAPSGDRHVSLHKDFSVTNALSYLWPGVPFALGAAALFGASAPLSKLLIGAIDPWLLAGILYLGAGVGLALVHWGRPLLGLASVEAPLQRPDMPWLAAVVFFGGLLGPLFLMFGLARTSAASGSLLLNLEGLATMAIAWLVFRRRPARVRGLHRRLVRHLPGQQEDQHRDRFRAQEAEGDRRRAPAR